MKLPENWGQCFDAAALTFISCRHDDARLCHGIGIANAPGQEGNVIKHAWIERDGIAYDVIWEVKLPADEYRKGLQVSYVVEYNFEEAWANWVRTNMPGPWCPKIAAIKDREPCGQS